MDDNHLYLMLGRMDGKLDAVLSKQESVDRRLDAHSKRITSLEAVKQRGEGFLSASRLGYVGLVGVSAFIAANWERVIALLSIS